MAVTTATALADLAAMTAFNEFIDVMAIAAARDLTDVKLTGVTDLTSVRGANS